MRGPVIGGSDRGLHLGYCQMVIAFDLRRVCTIFVQMWVMGDDCAIAGCKVVCLVWRKGRWGIRGSGRASYSRMVFHECIVCALVKGWGWARFAIHDDHNGGRKTRTYSLRSQVSARPAVSSYDRLCAKFVTDSFFVPECCPDPVKYFKYFCSSVSLGDLSP